MEPLRDAATPPSLKIIIVGKPRTPYLLATPVISFTLAGLWLGDHITARILLGAAITMGGVALVALADRRFRAVTPRVKAEPAI